MPFSLIRCSSSKVAFCSCVEWGWHIYNIVESESDPLTRRPVDVFEKEPLKGNSEVHLHTPTKFGEDRSKDLGGDREQTDRQTDKRCSIYSMISLMLNTGGKDNINIKRVRPTIELQWTSGTHWNHYPPVGVSANVLTRHLDLSQKAEKREAIWPSAFNT